MDPATVVTVGTTALRGGQAWFGDVSEGNMEIEGKIADPIPAGSSQPVLSGSSGGSSILPMLLIGGVAIYIIMR